MTKKTKKAPKKARPLTTMQRLSIARLKLRTLRKALNTVSQQREDALARNRSDAEELAVLRAERDALVASLAKHRAENGADGRAELAALRRQLDDTRKAYDDLMGSIMRGESAPLPTMPQAPAVLS